MCSSLLEMCVQSLKLIVWAVFVLELVKCSPPRNHSLAKFLYNENCNIKFSLKYVSNQLTVCQISFEIFDVKQIYSREKCKYLNSIRLIPFFYFIFLPINEDTRKMENCKANHILDRSSHRRCSVGKDVSEKKFRKIHRKTHMSGYLYIRASGTSVFLWILRNF